MKYFLFILLWGACLFAYAQQAALPPLPVNNPGTNQAQLQAGPGGMAATPSQGMTAGNANASNTNASGVPGTSTADFISKFFENADVDHFAHQSAADDVFKQDSSE